jgi:methyl-accepting chemotaxis protein
LFAKVKHLIGKDLARKQVWVFGMVDVKPVVIFFECVPDRTALTLLSIIYEHVVPDTTVNSDCWASYNKINLLHQSRIKHQTVNHKYNFVDPTSSTHTNKIESKWCVAKLKFKVMRECSRMYIQSYLAEFMWRQNNKLDRKTAFNEIFKALKNVYDSFEYREFKNQMDENIGDIIFDQQDDEDGQDVESDEYLEFFERLNFFFDMTTVDVEQVNDHVEQVNDHVEQVNDHVEQVNDEYPKKVIFYSSYTPLNSF